MGLLPDTQNCGLRMRRECRERFPHHRFQRKSLVSDPGMHHGTCGTHVPWCMSGLLTCGDGENVPGIPAHAQPAILRIWQEVHGISNYNSVVVQQLADNKQNIEAYIPGFLWGKSPDDRTPLTKGQKSVFMSWRHHHPSTDPYNMWQMSSLTALNIPQTKQTFFVLCEWKFCSLTKLWKLTFSSRVCWVFRDLYLTKIYIIKHPWAIRWTPCSRIAWMGYCSIELYFLFKLYLPHSNIWHRYELMAYTS